MSPSQTQPSPLDPSGSLPPATFAWFALQVRAQYEKRVAEGLTGIGYEPFLPQYRCRRRWSDRIKEFDTALFPGYLFCRFDPLDRLPILKTPGVIQIVGYNRVPIPLDESEILAVQTLVDSGVPNQPWPFLAVGDRVRVESGPLRGMEGILTAFKGQHRLLISITLLQRSVSAELDAAYVTLLSSVRTQQPREQVCVKPRKQLLTA
jgi:transcription antitermination factor NusG